MAKKADKKKIKEERKKLKAEKARQAKAKKEAKRKAKKDAKKAKTTQAKTVKKAAPKKKRGPVYHVSQNKKPKMQSYKMWRVRKQLSTKTIKFFDTQQDAIAFATELAKNNNGSIVIHTLEGKIRKQKY